MFLSVSAHHLERTDQSPLEWDDIDCHNSDAGEAVRFGPVFRVPCKIGPTDEGHTLTVEAERVLLVPLDGTRFRVAPRDLGAAVNLRQPGQRPSGARDSLATAAGVGERQAGLNAGASS